MKISVLALLPFLVHSLPTVFHATHSIIPFYPHAFELWRQLWRGCIICTTFLSHSLVIIMYSARYHIHNKYSHLISKIRIFWQIPDLIARTTNIKDNLRSFGFKFIWQSLKCYVQDNPSCVGCRILWVPSARRSASCFDPPESGHVLPNISGIPSSWLGNVGQPPWVVMKCVNTWELWKYGAKYVIA